MDREEKLARVLVQAYDGEIIDRPKDSCPLHLIRLSFHINGTQLNYTFRSWHEILFGVDDGDAVLKPLNFFVECWDDKSVIEYSSLDELEIQLTLMGRNPS